MEYNDNDYEGNNLHLTGEESSKCSYTLRPFVLPKFDFDDNLHGNSRFDTLVDNEVFLGIPSQDDNQWVEDFCRGSSGIRFCSSATVSCALPRFNNVWSEATSSESVEMLLKAVGQEEMIPGESMFKEMHLGDPVDSKGPMGTSVRQDDKIDDVDGGTPLLPPGEAEKCSSMLNQSEGIEGVPHDAEEQNLSSYGVSVDDKENSLFVTSTNLSDMRGTCEDKRERHDLVNDSLSEQVQEKLPVSDIRIDNVDSSCQEHAGMLVDQDNISDVSFVSSNFASTGINKGIDEQKEDLNASDETFCGNTDQTANSEQGSLYFPPVADSLNQEHVVEIQVNNLGETLSMPETRESVSVVEDCGKVACDVEPAVDSGCTDGPDIKGSDDTPKICVSIVTKQVSVTRLSDQPESHDGDEDIYPVSSISLEAPLATFESYVPCKSNSHHADGPDNSLVSFFAGELGSENSGIERITEVIHTDTLQKDSLDEGDHVSPLLLDVNKHICEEDGLSKQADDDLSLQVDVQGGDLDISACEKDYKLPAGECNVVPDDYGKDAGFEFSGEVVEVYVESATGSQSSASAGDPHVLNTEVADEKLKSFCPDSKVLADCRVQNSPSINMGHSDQNKELDAAIQSSTLSSMQSLQEVAEVATGTKLENNETLDSVAAVGREADDPFVSLVEMTNATMPDAATLQLSEKVDHSANDSIVLNDVFEAELTEKTTTKLERSSGSNAFKVSDSGSAAKINESNQPGISSKDLTGQAQGELNKTDDLERDIGYVSDVLPTSMSSSVNVLSKQEETFTFDVRPLGGQSTEDSDKSFQQIPRIHAVISSTGEGSPSTSGSRQKDTGIVKVISLPASLRLPSSTLPSEGVKSSSDRKPRRRSSESGKESAKKENLVKETILSQQTERLDKSSTFPSPLGAGQVMTFDGALKPISGISVSTSSLLDLNISGPSSACFQQPFTDLQQVQLRAQIFVYGSLIQGATPDEACMVSAFDGGRSVWEPSWRACIEKHHDKKYQANKTETPLHSRSGAKATDQTSTQGLSQSEVLSTPIGRASDKAAPSPLANPIIPLSSPMWNISTPSSAGLPSSSIARFDYQGVSSLHPYQTPPVHNFVAHTTTWPSQAPYPVPWLASSKSSPFDIRAIYSASPITEPVKLTPINESSLHVAPAFVPHVPAIHTGATTVFAGTPIPMDLKKVEGSTSQTPAETKTRKRKNSAAADAVNIPVTAFQVDNVSTPVILNYMPEKVPALEDLNHISLAARNQADSVSTIISSNYSTPATVPTASLMPKGTPNHILSVVLPSVSSDLQRGELRVDKRALNLGSFSKVEEAKLQAEQAATLAAEAVGHCQSVWSQLDQQKSANMTTDAESKLASAVVAIAAAASVAKAAAAAAKIAYNAAAQAKQMADEAVTAHGTPSTTSYNTAFASSYGNITPLSTFWGSDSNNTSTLAISAAREAARKRVKAASVASRHAENLDAIVKAAELAAEAVSHTGKIVGMGDPFSLNELVKAGPEGYWKISHGASASGSALKDTNKSKFLGVNAEESPGVSRNLHGGPDKDVLHTSHVVSHIQTDVHRNIVNDSTIAEENSSSSAKNGGKSVKPQKDERVVDCSEVIGSVSELDVELKSSSFIPSYKSNNASIKEGAAVEVLKDFGDVRKGWFSGSVLSLKDDQALVCYIELQSDGSEPLEEWVSLEARGGKAPLIRIPHPMTALRFDGTRKRRRSAIKDYTWSVGDRVDVLVKDCWREGVIAEKNNKDPTTVTVKIPAEEMLAVKAWHLRPTLIWGDGQWCECSTQGENGTSQGDTPAGKRPKLGSADLESKGKRKMARKIGLPEAGKTEEPKLPLSNNESVFNIGSMREESKVRTMRSGLQKEGPRVVFGIPKPGKKRKFMEVSKHYDSERPNKTSVPNDSVKSAKPLMPLGFGSRSSKNNSKVDLKEKQVPESNPRAVRSRKPPVPTRPLPHKGDSTSSRPNTSNATSSNDDNESGEQNVNDPNVEETSRGTFVFSSLAPPTESRNKAAIRNTNKGKLLPSSAIGKFVKTGSHEKSASEVTEPRRSNRRIQPTSRLLEGLQSSLAIPKFPLSHGKGQRSHRGTPKRE